jgi:hypothetical protein
LQGAAGIKWQRCDRDILAAGPAVQRPNGDLLQELLHTFAIRRKF